MNANGKKVISTCIPTYAPLFRTFASTLSASYYYGHNTPTYALATRRRARTGTGTHDATITSTSMSQLDRDLEILDDGTTIQGKGGGFETTIVSVPTPVRGSFHGGRGRARDSDSEELIKRSTLQVQMPGAGQHEERGTPPGTSASEGAEEDPFQIHTFTEFKVERHQV